jgi:hypothetical protein
MRFNDPASSICAVKAIAAQNDNPELIEAQTQPIRDGNNATIIADNNGITTIIAGKWNIQSIMMIYSGC